MLNPVFPLQPWFVINARWKQRSASKSTTEDCHNFTSIKCSSSFNSIPFVSVPRKNRKPGWRLIEQQNKGPERSDQTCISPAAKETAQRQSHNDAQSPVPGTCSSRVTWAKYPTILSITKWTFPEVFKIILWHILSLPTSCKELLNSQRRIHFALMLTLNLLALWTCTLGSPWLQHSEKEMPNNYFIWI